MPNVHAGGSVAPSQNRDARPRPSKVRVQSDCPGDVSPGNDACDLPPGVYGDLVMENASELHPVGAGGYVFCDVVAGRNVTILGAGATVYLPASGDLKLNNAGLVGTACGEIRVLKHGRGAVRFGRNSAINMRLCAPEATVNLGHGNTFSGQFFGETVDADAHNQGGCCPGMCACFDTFDPKVAAEHATVVMERHCDLMPVTMVRVCGKAATIVSQATHEIGFEVAAGLSGQTCDVEVMSPAGVFRHAEQLTVS